MRLFAHYDESGKIHSLIWFNAPQGVSLTLTPQVGQLVTEIKNHNLTSSPPSEKTLRNISKSHTIAAPTTRHTLTKNRKGLS